MRTRKLVAAVALGALLGSELAYAVSPALGQTPGNGNSPTLMPSMGGGDGTYGRVLPGPGTTAPYAVPQPPQMSQPAQPQVIQRSAGLLPVNVCQPGGGVRTYQTVSVPRTTPVEPLLPAQPPAATVTQVTVSQSTPGVPAQTNLPPTALSPTTELRTTSGTGGPMIVPEVDELSRIEAGFNLDPIRIQQISTPLLAPTVSAQQREPQLQSPGQPLQSQVQQLQPASQQRPVSPEQGYLGPFGTPLRQYGYSMFASNVSTFAPVDDIPVGPDYVLGPGC